MLSNPQIGRNGPRERRSYVKVDEVRGNVDYKYASGFKKENRMPPLAEVKSLHGLN